MLCWLTSGDKLAHVLARVLVLVPVPLLVPVLVLVLVLDGGQLEVKFLVWSWRG